MTRGPKYPTLARAVKNSFQGTSPVPGMPRLLSQTCTYRDTLYRIRHSSREAALLVGHVEGVEVHLHVARSHVPAIAHRIFGNIQEVRFEPVHWLHRQGQLACLLGVFCDLA